MRRVTLKTANALAAKTLQLSKQERFRSYRNWSCSRAGSREHDAIYGSDVYLAILSLSIELTYSTPCLNKKWTPVIFWHNFTTVLLSIKLD